ncbi:hypothetical protein S245_015022, partial [Arachis hypogaea]
FYFTDLVPPSLLLSINVLVCFTSIAFRCCYVCSVFSFKILSFAQFSTRLVIG